MGAPSTVSYARAMPGPSKMDIGAVLSAAYHRPPNQLDQLAAKVQAKLALLETSGEFFRLLVEAPTSALRSSLPASDETFRPAGENS